ncbi:hypothetical protein AVEN_144121-1 [Araneus ventricosus]|uniref:Uncharacterized protein n=1 Tax=Araneus ventricosus TaxID=182803 RepID=A0A4Y2X9Z5_ARAVE|nr:hypothetical protein AVEN_144121-1 [Araneus ventricosus]
MSTLSWEALLDCMKTTLKTHCDTRWSSGRQAVTALQKNLPSVHKVLEHMTDRANKWTADAAFGAMILLRHIDDKFLCLLEMWSEVLVKLVRKVKKMAGEMAEYEAHLICAGKSFELECLKVYDR